MAFQDTSKANIPFKRLLGKIHTSNERGPANEPESSNFQVLAQLGWGDQINLQPDHASNAGIISPLLTLNLVPVSGTNNSGKYSAYFVVLGSSVPASLQGKINPRTNAPYAANDRVGNIVPASLADAFRPKLFKGAVETPPLDASDWFIDTDAGVVTQETDDAGSMIDYSTGGTVQCYVYVGRSITQAIADAEGAIPAGTVEHVFRETVVNSGESPAYAPTFVLPHPAVRAPRVLVNGLEEDDGDAYVFENDTDIVFEAGYLYSGDKVVIKYEAAE